MNKLIEQMDYAFSGLAWSLWNTLGVSGEGGGQQDCMIDLEALVLLTALIGKSDPRLFEEALDWCSKFHYFISVSRLKTLIQDMATIHAPFSLFASTLNSISQSKWPTFDKISPLHLKPRGKSRAPNCKIPALLGLRTRALFGISARADLITFLLTRNSRIFTAADTVEVGYNKKTLAETLDSFVESGLLNSTIVRNQKQYECSKTEQLMNLVGELPQVIPDWRSILMVFVSLRDVISKYQNHSSSSQVVAIANAFEQLKEPLRKLNLSPPILPSDSLHWDSFIQQSCDLVKSLAIVRENSGDVEETFFSLMQKLYRVDDCVDGLEFLIDQSAENPTKHQEIFKECYQMSLCYLEELQSSLDDLIKFPIYRFMDIKLSEATHRYSQVHLPAFLYFVKHAPQLTEMDHAAQAFHWYRELEQELKKIHRFLNEFKERLKALHVRKTSIHLLTYPPVLHKRHAVLKLFS